MFLDYIRYEAEELTVTTSTMWTGMVKENDLQRKEKNEADTEKRIDRMYGEEKRHRAKRKQDARRGDNVERRSWCHFSSTSGS